MNSVRTTHSGEQTKEMQMTVEVPVDTRDGDLESDVVSGVLAVKSAKNTEPLCPTCDNPYDSRGRVGWNHPIDLGEDVVQVCTGENGKDHEGVGGLTWMYNHIEGQV